MPVDVYINNVRLPRGPLRGSLSVFQRQGQRHTSDFTYDQLQESDPVPVVGQTLRIVEQPGNNVIFGGVIQVVNLNGVRLKEGWLRRYKVSAMDYRWLAERRNAGENTWTNWPAGYIFRAIVQESLAGDNIDLSEVLPSAGPNIKEFKVDFPTVAQALDRLVELWPGSAWWIDYDRKAHFELIDLQTPTYQINAADPPIAINSLEIERTREAYANAITVRIQKYETEQLTAIYSRFGEDQPPDGSRRDWQLQWPISRAPSVFVDDVPQTVGVQGVDVGVFQWYWEQGSNVLKQSTAGPALSNLRVLRVVYVGLRSQTFYRRDEAEIAAIGALEGNAGVYEQLVDVSSIVARGDAEQMADAILEYRKQLGIVLKCKTTWRKEADTTFRPRPADVIRVNRATYGGQVSFVVESVGISELGDQECHLIRNITGRSGPVALDAVKFFGASGSASGSAAGSAVSGGAGAGRPRHYVIPSAANITIDLADGIAQEILWDRDIAIADPNGAQPGESLVLIIRKANNDDALQLTFGAAWLIDPDQVDARANATTVITFTFDRDSRAIPNAPFGKAA